MYDEKIFTKGSLWGDGSDTDDDRKIKKFSHTDIIEANNLLILEQIEDIDNAIVEDFNFVFGIGKGDTIYLKPPTKDAKDDGIISLTLDNPSDKHHAMGLCDNEAVNTESGTFNEENECQTK